MVEYCHRWNHRRNRPGTVLSETEARARDAAGTEYTAILPPRPDTRLPVLVTPVWRSDVVVVSFLDDCGRKVVEYTFAKRDERQLFLDTVHLWSYSGNDPGLRLSDATVREVIHYSEDGGVQRVITNKSEEYEETVEYTGVPVDANWEPIPSFGAYESIGRFERGRRPLDDVRADARVRR